jgi:hypothetical protein
VAVVTGHGFAVGVAHADGTGSTSSKSPSTAHAATGKGTQTPPVRRHNAVSVPVAATPRQAVATPQTVTPERLSASDGPVGLTSAPALAESARSASAVTTTEAAVPKPPAIPVITELASAVVAVLSPSTVPGPTPPAEPPLISAILAWAQRETRRTTTADPAAIGNSVIAALVSLVGQVDSVQYSADGLHALVIAESQNGTSTTTSVALVNTVTGATMSSQTFNGSFNSIHWNTNAATPRVSVFLDTLNAAGAQTTTIQTINTATGNPVASYTIPGKLRLGTLVATLQYSADGRHAVVITQSYDSAGRPIATYATVINTTTGVPASQPVSFPSGVPNSLVLTPTRAVLTYLDSTSNTYRVAFIDTNTGQRTGTYSFPANQQPVGPDGILMSPNHTHVTIITVAPDTPGEYTTTFTTFDPATGRVVDSARFIGTVITPGQNNSSVPVVQYNTNRSQAFMRIDTNTGDTGVAIVDTTTGSLHTYTTPGTSVALTLNPIGTRALLTYTDNSGNYHLAILTTNATQIGRTIDLTSAPTIITSADATHATLITTNNNNTTVTTINLNTGALSRL